MRCAHCVGQIGALRFYLLQADDIGVICVEPFETAFVDGGADAVKIECRDAHG